MYSRIDKIVMQENIPIQKATQQFNTQQQTTQFSAMNNGQRVGFSFSANPIQNRPAFGQPLGTGVFASSHPQTSQPLNILPQKIIDLENTMVQAQEKPYLQQPVGVNQLQAHFQSMVQRSQLSPSSRPPKAVAAPPVTFDASQLGKSTPSSELMTNIYKLESVCCQ